MNCIECECNTCRHNETIYDNGICDECRCCDWEHPHREGCEEYKEVNNDSKRT